MIGPGLGYPVEDKAVGIDYAAVDAARTLTLTEDLTIGGGYAGTLTFSASGDNNPLISGKLFFFESGTNTDIDTFSDVALAITNTNPVILTAAGRQPNRTACRHPVGR